MSAEHDRPERDGSERDGSEPDDLDRGLLCALAVVAGGSLIIGLDAPQPLRALAAALVLWAPGYALSSLLLPRATIGGVTRAVTALALSAALTIVCAVALEAAGVRLRSATFLAMSCAITWLTAGVALVRATRQRGGQQPDVPRWRAPAGASATVFVIGLVLAGSLAVARVAPEPSGIPGSSMLAAARAQPGTIRAQVVSDELAETAYRLELATTDVVVARFTLRPGAAWRRTIAIPPDQDRAELVLYRAENVLPYRSVVIQGLR